LALSSFRSSCTCWLPRPGFHRDLSTNLRLLRISPDTPLTGPHLKSLGSPTPILRSALAWRHPSLAVTRGLSVTLRLT
jgi:hypothetical protein